MIPVPVLQQLEKLAVWVGQATLRETRVLRGPVRMVMVVVVAVAVAVVVVVVVVVAAAAAERRWRQWVVPKSENWPRPDVKEVRSRRVAKEEQSIAECKQEEYN